MPSWMPRVSGGWRNSRASIRRPPPNRPPPSGSVPARVSRCSPTAHGPPPESLRAAPQSESGGPQATAKPHSQVTGGERPDAKEQTEQSEHQAAGRVEASATPYASHPLTVARRRPSASVPASTQGIRSNTSVRRRCRPR
jgi:hypothetical protein